jgi:catechol 2,3-dioxygenase-like lactoylglutathione lyase family enzyme
MMVEECLPHCGCPVWILGVMWSVAVNNKEGGSVRIRALDHWVLTVADIDTSIVFYHEVLGMEPLSFGQGQEVRQALRFGSQKINLHQAGAEFEPKAKRPTPGSADLCLLIEGTLEEAIAHLRSCGVAIEAGPVERTGATGPLQSIYIRYKDK